MAQDMSRQDERRGTRRLLMTGAIGALIIGIGLIAWPWVFGFQAPSAPTETTGIRSHQVEGASAFAGRNPAPPKAGDLATNPANVGYNEKITATSKPLLLNADQRNALNDFATQHRQAQIDYAGFTIAVGAAVPRNIELKDVPVWLSDKLAAYSGDQFLMVPNQLIIVEKPTRRIVAIIPVSS